MGRLNHKPTNRISSIMQNRNKAVQFHVKVPYETKAENDWVIASCPPFEVLSQGRTEEEAVRNLFEAIQLFVESCYRRGTLQQVLEECGFKPDRSHADIDVLSGDHLMDVPLPLLIAKNAENHPLLIGKS